MSVSLSFEAPLTEEAQTIVCDGVSGSVAGSLGISEDYVSCALTPTARRRLLAVFYDTAIIISIPVTETVEGGGSAVDSIAANVADTTDLAAAIASDPVLVMVNNGVEPTTTVADVEIVVSDCSDPLFEGLSCTEATSSPTAVPTTTPTATPTAVPTTTPTATPDPCIDMAQCGQCIGNLCNFWDAGCSACIECLPHPAFANEDTTCVPVPSSAPTDTPPTTTEAPTSAPQTPNSSSGRAFSLAGVMISLVCVATML